MPDFKVTENIFESPLVWNERALFTTVQGTDERESEVKDMTVQ